MRIRCQEKHKVYPLCESREVLSAQRSALTLEGVLRGCGAERGIGARVMG